jgi:hypothetical protein
MISGQGSRQRQSTLTLGAGEPFGLHVNTVICTSLKKPGHIGEGTRFNIVVV